jgi:malate permease and related proteins
MAAVLAAIVLSTGAGVAVERRDPERTRRAITRLLDLLLWVVSPALAFIVLARFEPTAGAGAGLLFGHLAAVVSGAAGYLAATRLLGLRGPQAGALTVAVLFGNTGYLGIPLAAALLGREAIAPAVAYDLLVSGTVFSIGAFAVGAALGTRAGGSPRERFRAYLTRNPVLAASVLGLLAPDALVPDAALAAAEGLALVLLPVGFFLLGAHLAEVPLRAAGAPVAAAAVIKLGIAPAVVAGASALTLDVPPAYLLLAAMPAGINSLLVAHAFGLDLRLTAAIVAWTHAVVVVVAGAAALL